MGFFDAPHEKIIGWSPPSSTLQPGCSFRLDSTIAELGARSRVANSFAPPSSAGWL